MSQAPDGLYRGREIEEQKKQAEAVSAYLQQLTDSTLIAVYARLVSAALLESKLQPGAFEEPALKRRRLEVYRECARYAREAAPVVPEIMGLVSLSIPDDSQDQAQA